MIPLSHVNWGPTDALARDQHFIEKWVEPDEIKKCLISENWLISGEKGSGKSAIRRALVEIYGDQYLVAPIVDFNDITFKALYEHIVQLANTTRLSKTTTLSHFWQYAIIIELLIACANKNPKRYGDLLERIPVERASVSLNERLMRLLEEAWNKIDDFTGINGKPSNDRRKVKANLVASSGLTANFLNHLSNFPVEQDFLQLKNEFFNRIESENDRIVLVLDGFDRLKNDGTRREEIGLIFASLVDAIQVINCDPYLPGTFEIKAFIPHDRYVALPLRDSDKVDTMHVAIRWTRPSLQEFLKKRIELTPKLQQGNFQLLWRQVMPEKILNSHYRIEEDSFDYIVRHTMYRPRQMQIHLENLASEHRDKNIDPSMIPNSIAESSEKIAKYFIDEFKTEHPKLGHFIASLHKKDNVMEYVKFKKIVADAITKFHPKQVGLLLEDKVDTLYSMGFFGIVNFVEHGDELINRYCPPSRESKRHYVNFFFKSPHPSISGTLNDDSLIAIHPIFVNYSNLRPHPTLIIG